MERRCTHSEANFDSLVGPTHNYAGLSYGNVASTGNGQRAANPRLASPPGPGQNESPADLGNFARACSPLHERLDVASLRQLGCRQRRPGDCPRRARSACRAGHAARSSPMWDGQRRHRQPSADSADGRVHFPGQPQQ